MESSVWLHCIQQVLGPRVLSEVKAGCVLRVEAAFAGELDAREEQREEQPGGEEEAAWVLRAGKNPSAAVVLLAEHR